MEWVTRDEKLHDLSVSIAALTNPQVHRLEKFDADVIAKKLAELIWEMHKLLEEEMVNTPTRKDNEESE